MSEETVVDPAQAAPEVVETASTVEAPVSGENTPDATEVETKSAEAKTFTQEEVDALIAKRVARVERKMQREQRPIEAAPVAQDTPVADVEPQPENFNTTQEYIKAAAKYEADKLFSQKMTEHETRQREARGAAAQQEAVSKFKQLEESARDKYDDYDDVAYNPALPITQHMALAIQNSEVGPELIRHLGLNIKEADRIARLHPLLQAKELGKLEAKLSTGEPAPKPAKPSNAPDPIRPVGGKGSAAAQTYDTTDPRSTKTMSASEWIIADRQRQEAKWKAAHS